MSIQEVRCDSGILFGILNGDERYIETKCRSNHCGASPGVVVLHRFSVQNGQLISTTKKYKDPAAVSRRGLKKGVKA